MAKIITKYHYFYKITNNLNGHFYYGVHNTNNLDDGYMGSGTRLKYAYKKYGIENFSKEILKYFNTQTEAFKYESEVVTEDLVKNDNCYNVKEGGKGWLTTGLTAVRDKDGNQYCVLKDDKRIITGELVHCNKGKAPFIDKNGNYILTDKNDERFLNGEIHGITLNKIPVKDKSNKFFLVDKNDPRYLSGELKPTFYGKHHKQETKEKMKEIYKKNKHQQGEKNSQFGTCWIYNDKESIKIKKEQLQEYISNGWVKGRKMNLKKRKN